MFHFLLINHYFIELYSIIKNKEKIVGVKKNEILVEYS